MSESITCPRCGMTSHNPSDVKMKYCGNCHDFHEAMMIETVAGKPLLTRTEDGAVLISRRTWLTLQTMDRLVGVGWFLAAEAVASTAIEHAEWDMDELKTYAEWENHD